MFFIEVFSLRGTEKEEEEEKVPSEKRLFFCDISLAGHAAARSVLKLTAVRGSP